MNDTSPAVGNTAAQIVAVATELIQTRGYSAFSYQDIADRMGIRKASIHYHFSGKADLGVAVIESYSANFAARLASATNETASTPDIFRSYCEPYRSLSDTGTSICLSGALAGEFLALPEVMRPVVKRFFTMHQEWLAAIFERGIARGEIRPGSDPARMARTVFASLQGALLVHRATLDSGELEDVIATIEWQLFAPGPQRGPVENA